MTRFSNHSKRTFSPHIQKQIKDLLFGVENFKTEVETIIEPYNKKPKKIEIEQKLEKIFSKFHSVAKQLQNRQRSRSPFEINDEYDVQDLLHALLKIDFRDIRAEEYCPSYASTSPRVDFFLKRVNIAIEAKMARKGHGNKKISNELIIDKEYYQKKMGVNTLYCFIYDPDEIIKNVPGFKDDLYEKSEKFEAKAYVIPSS